MGMNINPQMINMLKSGNPQQIAMNLLQQKMGGNPILENVFKLANSGNMKGVEDIARNLYKSRGANIDEAYNQITSTMNMK